MILLRAGVSRTASSKSNTHLPESPAPFQAIQGEWEVGNNQHTSSGFTYKDTDDNIFFPSNGYM